MNILVVSVVKCTFPIRFLLKMVIHNPQVNKDSCYAQEWLTLKTGYRMLFFFRIRNCSLLVSFLNLLFSISKFLFQKVNVSTCVCLRLPDSIIHRWSCTHWKGTILNNRVWQQITIGPLVLDILNIIRHVGLSL